MKLYDFSAGEFAALLERAHGKISLILTDSTIFSITSKLSQLYCIRMLLDNAREDSFSPELVVEDEDDRRLFLRYLMRRCEKRSGWGS